MSDLRQLTDAQLDENRKLLARLEKQLLAKDQLLPFIQYTMPHPDHEDDAEFSLYEITPQAQVLCEAIERIDRGEIQKLAISIGPQHGKSEIISRRAPAWLLGRNPRRKLMLGSYNQDKANEFGDDVRSVMQQAEFRHVFPGTELDRSAISLLTTKKGGKAAFLGTGGSGTGFTADIFVVDDPFKNDEEAQSDLIRDRVWKWFTSVVNTRGHNNSAVIVVHTRWHEDDLIGRLCDPTHPEREKAYAGVADGWVYINLPAVVEDPDLACSLGLELSVPEDPLVIRQFGKAPKTALWPQRHGLRRLAEAKQLDRRVFGALYMGQPAPDEGDFFLADWIVEYTAQELPDNLVKYGASDHAVTIKKENDLNCIGCVGIDENSDIWVLPDVVWERMETDRVVEEILTQMQVHDPRCWWMESENISKAFGPFLKKRMVETHTYCTIRPDTPSTDKKARARSIQGRMAQKKVRFPAFAPWWQNAKQELLKFPNSAHDDFVDWLGIIGRGLHKEHSARKSRPEDDLSVVKVGSPAWIKAAAKARERRERQVKMQGGW